MLRNRCGTTLVELLVALVVMGLVGASLVRLMSSQSRFLADQEGSATARRVARGGINLLLSDLRRVETDSGVVAATPTTLTVRLPYWVGISCGPDAGLSGTHVAMAAVDSIVLADAGYTGYGYVDSLSVPHFVAGGNFGAGTASVCTAAGINTVAHPRARVMKVTPAEIGAPAGTPVFVWHTVTYAFLVSASAPGRIGLFRTVGSKFLTEEVAAPFDNSAAFAYYVPGSTTPVSSPTPGTTVLGVDLSLIGLNEVGITNGKTQQAPFETALYFRNR